MREKHCFKRLHDVLYANATRPVCLLLSRYTFENYELVYSFSNFQVNLFHGDVLTFFVL